MSKYIYTRKKKDDRNEIECNTLDKARNKALEDYRTGNYIPLHISNKRGVQVMSHAALREFLLTETGRGRTKRSWQN